MKYFTLFILLASLSIGCSSSSSPSGVAEAFLDAMKAGKCDKAKKFCTPRSEQGVGFMCLAFEAQKGNIAEITILSEEVQETTAQVKYTIVGPNGTEESNLDLVKTNEGWRVDLGSMSK